MTRRQVEAMAGFGVPEADIAGMIGVEHAICVPQARFGLYLLLTRLLTPDRPEVVMSPYTTSSAARPPSAPMMRPRRYFAE